MYRLQSPGSRGVCEGASVPPWSWGLLNDQVLQIYCFDILAITVPAITDLLSTLLMDTFLIQHFSHFT